MPTEYQPGISYLETTLAVLVTPICGARTDLGVHLLFDHGGFRDVHPGGSCLWPNCIWRGHPGGGQRGGQDLVPTTVVVETYFRRINSVGIRPCDALCLR